MRIVYDYSFAVDVRHVCDIHVHDGTVVEEGSASPFAATKAYAAIAEAVVDAAVETNVRSPVTAMPAIEAAFKSPVAGSPKHADGPNDPSARDPVIAVVITPRPVTGRPKIASTGTDGLRVNGQRGWTDAYVDSNSDSNLRRRC